MPEALPKYRLKKDLYVFNRSETKDLEYRLFTKAQLDEIVSVQYPAGTVFDHDAEHGVMTSQEYGEIGLDPGDPDPDWWEPYDPLDRVAGVYSVVGPEGETIVGTFEALTGAAVITGVAVTADGGIEPQYEGSTEIHWNDQCTKYAAGERLYIDNEGAVFRESQLVLTLRPPEIETGAKAVANFPFDSEGGHCD